MESERLIETVAKARRGDDNAMTDLYLDAYRSVYYLALRIVKNPEDAEDITQEVFITAREKLPELREPAAFYAWLNQITVNKCNRLLSKNKGIVRIDEEEFITLADDNPLNLPDKAIDDEDTRRIILEVIDGLPDNQRICVMLFYYAQFTVTQIADIQETNENTVKSRLALARAKIRAALEEKEKKEGIKLYGIPLALTPILRQAMEQFVMPDGAEARMWENIQKAASKSAPTNGGNKPGTGGEEVHTATSAGMTLVTKIIIGIIAAAVIAAGAIFIPRLLESPPEETAPPAVTDAATTAPDDTEGQRTEATPPDDTAVVDTFNINSVVGDIITFGTYNGEPIEWRVLEVTDGKTLIIAEKILTKRMYYGHFADTNGDGYVDWGGDEFNAAGGAEAFVCTWETSDIRNWLNDEFYTSAFNLSERDKILQTTISTPDRPGSETPGGNDTSDKLFLLSTAEASTYFPEHDTQAIYGSEDYPSEWWIRSPGGGRNTAMFVSSNGNVNDNGDVVMNVFGVRPALWLTIPGTTNTATD